MINNMNLVGRLTKDIDLHYTASGKAVASFTLASQRNYPNANGEYEADFIDCVIWGKPAEALERNTKKGMLIGVTGPLRKRFYENKEHIKVYVTEILVETYQQMEFLQKEQVETVDKEDPINHTDPSKQSIEEDPFNIYKSVDLDDEDLPF
ncbi:single-stranded DNA-binding protein [Enterococcus faecalis]|uniref:single-stranded DNA-binding protein n=1 Tax=Enterococcus faecalis TaxID=1351 RepID=UPI001EECF498|nr:single-stranded DNA-binding protein [Enterococcus faecalis]BDC77770.1 single-stranded DNA-binding protein [Enterococcus faecalis]